MTDLQTILIAIGLLALIVTVAATVYGMETDRRSADAFYRRLNAERDARYAARRARFAGSR